MHCPTCGDAVVEGFRFCGSCGAAVPVAGSDARSTPGAPGSTDVLQPERTRADEHEGARYDVDRPVRRERRPRVLVTVAAGVVLALLAGVVFVQLQGPAASPGVLARADVARTGAFDDVVAGLDEAWRAQLEWDGVQLGPVGPGAVADGVVYLPDGGSLHAVDAGTGALKWRAPLGEVISTEAPVVVGDLVLTLVDGGVVAVTRGDGEQVWRAGLDDMALGGIDPLAA